MWRHQSARPEQQAGRALLALRLLSGRVVAALAKCSAARASATRARLERQLQANPGDGGVRQVKTGVEDALDERLQDFPGCQLGAVGHFHGRFRRRRQRLAAAQLEVRNPYRLVGETGRWSRTKTGYPTRNRFSVQ